MILEGLLGAIVAAALFQPTVHRFFAAVVFVCVAWGHEVFFAHLGGFAYYASAASADLAIIILTSFLIDPPKMVLTLHRICLVSIVLNFIGWVAWRLYLPPEPYSAAMLCVFIWALVIFISRDKKDVGGIDTVDWRFTSFHIHNHPGTKFSPWNGA